MAFTDTFLVSLVPIIGVSLATMALLLALFYIASQFFKKPEYEAYISLEMHQLLASALIFILVAGTAISASYFVSLFCNGQDQFVVAQAYMNRVSQEEAVPLLVQLEWMKMIAQYWGSLNFRFGLTVWGASVPGFPSFVVLERVIDFLLMLLSPFVASLMVQQLGLEILKGTMLTYVLPAGVVMRIFPPTRDAGSFMIVSAFALYIVFPYTYVMHSNIIGAMREQEIAAKNNPASDTFSAYLDKLETDPDYSNLVLRQSAQKTTIFDFYRLDRILMDKVNEIAYIALQAVFLPALSITITIAFIKGTLKFVSQKLD